MKKIFSAISIAALLFLSCENNSVQKGQMDYSDTAENSSDTVTVPVTDNPTDSIMRNDSAGGRSDGARH